MVQELRRLCLELSNTNLFLLSAYYNLMPLLLLLLFAATPVAVCVKFLLRNSFFDRCSSKFQPI